VATSTAENRREELVQLLEREVECTRNLMQSLEIENEALSEHHTAALEEVIQDKQESIRQLESISHQRMLLLESITTKTAANDSYFNNDDNPISSNDVQIAILWKELMSLAEQCQKQNRINGSIVELGYQQSNYALDILRGTSSKSDLYDNNGQTTKSSPSKPITQA
jgi:flagellar biosynthesis/type III secretory pathway chaperone